MQNSPKAGDPDAISLGRALIASGRVGCIVLAGGDGSRLGWDGPKGTFPLSLVKQKSLFQMMEERVHAASAHFKTKLKLAMMTSPLNHEVTEEALTDTPCFMQGVLPLLDAEQQPLEETRPNGNGEVLKYFCASGLYDTWKKEGVEYVQVVLVDNPLAEPYDPNLIGVHFMKKAEVTLKAVNKKHPEEKVGVIGKKEGKVCIIEYTENPPAEWMLANTSLFCFSMDFAKKVSDIELPFHTVKKYLDGKPVFKRECFIFDLLAHSEKTEVLLYPREETFAPLKERADVGAVQRALLERDRKAYHKLTGVEPEERIFELHPSFHFPTDELKEKWQGRPLPDGSYIDP
ncbi:MAG: putative uridylyltransferase [Chlamydiae bacterium]|nr:putative uridylyltransferase [Chlamydiota bacterium]